MNKFIESDPRAIKVIKKSKLTLIKNSEGAKYVEIKKALSQKPKAFMDILKKHGLKPWDVKLE